MKVIMEGRPQKEGHQVYDFRHPIPGNNGFSWMAYAVCGGIQEVIKTIF